MMKSFKQGFTLAEVLTTLMVIGVVAAMTIPTLLNATQDQQLRVAYKKAMSVLSQGAQLMVAQERECVVTNDHTLATCMHNVIGGTLYAIEDGDHLTLDGVSDDEDGDGNVIVSNDGLAYAFYYRDQADNNLAAGAIDPQETPRSLATICGSGHDMFGSDADDWNGTNAKCYIIVDMNGPSKGTHSFLEDDVIDDGSLIGLSMGDDQMALLLAGDGVRPFYFTGDDVGKHNDGFTWIYGDHAGSPIVVNNNPPDPQ